MYIIIIMCSLNVCAYNRNNNDDDYNSNGPTTKVTFWYYNIAYYTEMRTVLWETQANNINIVNLRRDRPTILSVQSTGSCSGIINNIRYDNHYYYNYYENRLTVVYGRTGRKVFVAAAMKFINHITSLTILLAIMHSIIVEMFTNIILRLRGDF